MEKKEVEKTFKSILGYVVEKANKEYEETELFKKLVKYDRTFEQVKQELRDISVHNQLIAAHYLEDIKKIPIRFSDFTIKK